MSSTKPVKKTIDDETIKKPRFPIPEFHDSRRTGVTKAIKIATPPRIGTFTASGSLPFDRLNRFLVTAIFTRMGMAEKVISKEIPRLDKHIIQKGISY
jgi:hypothetical protein